MEGFQLAGEGLVVGIAPCELIQACREEDEVLVEALPEGKIRAGEHGAAYPVTAARLEGPAKATEVGGELPRRVGGAQAVEAL